jgi:hypothetical protein
MPMITARSKSSRIDIGAQTGAARTLSRVFWQQKNFRAHRLRVSTPLANDGFSLESNKADSGQHAPRTLRIVDHRKRSMTIARFRERRFERGARRQCRQNSDAEF